MRLPTTDARDCFTGENGRLRVVDPLVEQCKREETPLQWNQAGPQGPKGDTGPQGAQGPAGPAGSSGVAGQSGYQQVVESNNNFTLAAGTESVHVLSCPDGKKVIGRGFVLFNAGGFLSNNQWTRQARMQMAPPRWQACRRSARTS
jgi:hypothetical protein